MAINPAFDKFPLEASIIGKLVVSFGELELLCAVLAGAALANQNIALRAMYRSRSTGGRIELADVLMRDEFVKAGLADEYEETLIAVRHALSIRNQYAHCHWAQGATGLFYTKLEEAAQRNEGFSYDYKHINLTLLVEQEEFFDYVRSMLLHLESRIKISKAIEIPIFPRPSKRSLPLLHNLASKNVPHWLSEDRKRQHLERAVAAEGRVQPRKRPPSVLRLTKEEWAAKDAQEASSANAHQR
jgi:hypothetical protein